MTKMYCRSNCFIIAYYNYSNNFTGGWNDFFTNKEGRIQCRCSIYKHFSVEYKTYAALIIGTLFVNFSSIDYF